MYIVDPTMDSFDDQVIYLDFDGEEDVDYNGPVTVENIDVPAFSAPSDLAGQEQIIIGQVLDQIEDTFADSGLVFTTQLPTGETAYSTVYVGGSGRDFSQYGPVRSVAEDVDVGDYPLFFVPVMMRG